jgi:hypothetical protein
MNRIATRRWQLVELSGGLSSFEPPIPPPTRRIVAAVEKCQVLQYVIFVFDLRIEQLLGPPGLRLTPIRFRKSWEDLVDSVRSRPRAAGPRSATQLGSIVMFKRRISRLTLAFNRVAKCTPAATHNTQFLREICGRRLV